MSRIWKGLFFGAVIFNLILAAWSVLHSDIQFTSEIARDFFLFNEILQKKFVLIGPSSTTGLFHGPLWSYINFPAYLIGKGNPLAVGWFWVLLCVGFLISGFYIAKNLFDVKTAYFFTLMISVYGVFIAKGLYNPHGAMFVIPAFFFFFVKYQQTLKYKYLVAHVLLAGALVQLQMAIGIPFLILSFAYTVLMAFKRKKRAHLSAYLFLFAFVANFLLFDLRHSFLISKITIKFLTSVGRDHVNIISMLYQRIRTMTTGIEFLRQDSGYRNLVIFLIGGLYMLFQLKNNRFKNTYFYFLYFYFGYLLLSMLNAGGLLYFYFFPLFPLTFLIFSSFATSRYSKLFLIVFFVIFALNIRTAITDTIGDSASFGRVQDSWAFQKSVADKIFAGDEKKFGYFVYSPDSLAYREKFAMLYVSNKSKKQALYFQKQPITYIFVAAPPKGNLFMTEGWWIKNELHIEKTADSEVVFANGYKIEKFLLSDEEMRVKPEPNIDPGLSFR